MPVFLLAESGYVYGFRHVAERTKGRAIDSLGLHSEKRLWRYLLRLPPLLWRLTLLYTLFVSLIEEHLISRHVIWSLYK